VLVEGAEVLEEGQRRSRGEAQEEAEGAGLHRRGAENAMFRRDFFYSAQLPRWVRTVTMLLKARNVLRRF
jgi:hypothetical protein